MKTRVLAAFFALSAFALLAGDFSDAVAAFERGDTTSAETILQTILRSQPDNSAALGLLGAVYDREKKYTEADEAYRHALQLNPRSTALLNNYANHELATGNLPGARSTYLKVIALDPHHANANLQLASIAVQQKNGAEALKYLEHVPAADLASPQVEMLEMQALFLAGRDSEAKAILDRLSASSSDPRLSFSAGLALASVERYGEAEDFFSRALASAPSNFDILYNLGLAAFHARDLTRAHQVLETALAEHPDDVDTLYSLAAVDIELKQREAALELLAKAGRIDPSRANIQLALAQTAAALGYYGDSLLAYDNYLKLNPSDDSARRERAFALAASGKREDGLAALRKFLQSHPHDAAAYYEVAIFEAASNPEAAEAHLDKAISLQPDFVPARFGRGVLNYLQSKPAAALPDLEFAAAKYADNPQVLDRLGETYSSLGRNDDAVKMFRKASEVSPNDARILMHLSRTLSKTGHKEEAIAVLDRFRAIGPDQVNRVPAPGFVAFLSLPPEQQHARYREELERRWHENPQDPALNVRYLKLVIEQGQMDQASHVAKQLLALQPPAALAAEAGHALVFAQQYAEAKPLLQYACRSLAASDAQLDLAISVFYTSGATQGLSELDRVPESQRSGDYYLARAQMLDAAGKADEALDALQHALKAAPNRADLYQEFAFSLVRHAHAPEAVRLLDQASRLLPDNPEILLSKAAVLTSVQRVGEAERLLKEIQNRWPEWGPPYVTYGILLEGQKRSEEAKNQLETAITLGATTPEAYFYLAKSILNATPDRIDDAARAINQAIALQPGDPWMQALAGRIDYEKRDFSGAVEHLSEAIRLQPNYLQARFTLAQAYRALGRTEDAARESREFERLRQENPHADDDGFASPATKR